ncbi:hypothetical protein AB0C15_21280 [Micromonospora sp. NPDC048835]|uniref:hypothetical protein n=1 Tax=Micromonospora sp. NPDC048835 TaxID=3155147 RepID=UPI0033F2A11E
MRGGLLADQIVTLAAAFIGALFGLAAPVITNHIGRRDRERDSQRAIAEQILDLFDSPASLSEILGHDDSRVRRRLYLLALRLKSEKPRQAVMNVVAIAGDRDQGSDQLEEAWFVMTDEVGRICRQRIRA